MRSRRQSCASIWKMPIFFRISVRCCTAAAVLFGCHANWLTPDASMTFSVLFSTASAVCLCSTTLVTCRCNDNVVHRTFRMRTMSIWIRTDPLKYDNWLRSLEKSLFAACFTHVVDANSICSGTQAVDSWSRHDTGISVQTFCLKMSTNDSSF